MKEIKWYEEGNMMKYRADAETMSIQNRIFYDGRETWLRQVHIAGVPEEVFDISMKDGRFHEIRKTPKEAGEKLWIAPGLIDLHFHAGWTDFIHSVQEKRTAKEVRSMVRNEMGRLLRTGVTMIRDAGGLEEEDWQECFQDSRDGDVFPDAVLCADMIPARDKIDYERLSAVFESRQKWVKVMATGGVSTETEHVLESGVPEAELKKLIESLHAHGKKVMVHTWGGPVLDWIIDVDVDSVEHGIFMTRKQAERMARKHIPYVATTRIYQMIAAGEEPLVLPPFLRDRAKAACAAHGKAVGYALEEGVEIGFGTDFYSGDNLIPNELEELFSLQEYGMSVSQAWKSATETAAHILGLSATHGKIAEGYAADAVLYGADPYKASSAAALRGSIRVVFKNGQQVS